MYRQPVLTEKESRSKVCESGGDHVSIIICTKQRPRQLQQAIASIRRSSALGSRVEIVVVEEGESPRELADVRYVYLPEENRGFGYARNRGVEQVQNDIIVFIDDDCEAEQGWLEGLVEPLLRQPELVGVAGSVSVRNCGLIGQAENILGFPGGGLRYQHQSGGFLMPTRYLSTCNCAYRREAILQAGGFSEAAQYGGEDFLLAEQVSAFGDCVFSPLALVYHQARDRLWSVFTWFVRRGRSEIALLSITNSKSQFGWYVMRSSLSLRILGLGVLLVQWPSLVVGLPAGLSLYIGAILWRFRFALQYPKFRRAWWVVPVVKATMDVGAEVGRLRGLIQWGRP